MATLFSTLSSLAKNRSATVSFAQNTITVDVDVNGSATLECQLQNVSLTDAMEELGLPQYKSLQNIEFKLITLDLNMAKGSGILVKLNGNWNDEMLLSLSVSYVSGKVLYTLGAYFQTTKQLTKFNNSELVSGVNASHFYAVFSNQDGAPFQFSSTQDSSGKDIAPDKVITIRGLLLNLFVSIEDKSGKHKSSVLNQLSKLLGKFDLLLGAKISDPDSTATDIELQGHIALSGDGQGGKLAKLLAVTQPELVVTVQYQKNAVSASLDAVIDIPFGLNPDARKLQSSVRISLTETELQLDFDEDFANSSTPFTLYCLTLQNVGGSVNIVDVGEGGGAVELKFKLHDKENNADIYFAGFADVAITAEGAVVVNTLYLSITGTVSLGLLYDLAPVNHNDKISNELAEVSFSDLVFYMETMPDKEPDGTTFPVGMKFNGAFDAFGWDAFCDVTFNSSSAFSFDLAMDEITVKQGKKHYLVLSAPMDAKGEAQTIALKTFSNPVSASAKQKTKVYTGPQLSISSLENPHFDFDASIDFLDAEKIQMSGKLDKTEISLSLSEQQEKIHSFFNGEFLLSLEMQDDKSFTLHTTETLNLSEIVKDVAFSFMTFGVISLKDAHWPTDSFEITLDILWNKGEFELQASFSIEMTKDKKKLSVPGVYTKDKVSIKIKDPITKVEDIPKAFYDYFKHALVDYMTSILANDAEMVEKWLLHHLINDVALGCKILKSLFDYDEKKLANILSQLATVAADAEAYIGKILNDVGFTSREISNGIIGLYNQAGKEASEFVPAVAKALKGAEYGAAELGDGLHQTYQQLAHFGGNIFKQFQSYFSPDAIVKDINGLFSPYDVTYSISFIMAQLDQKYSIDKLKKILASELNIAEDEAKLTLKKVKADAETLWKDIDNELKKAEKDAKKVAKSYLIDPLKKLVDFL